MVVIKNFPCVHSLSQKNPRMTIRPRGSKVVHMTATQVINEIKALDPQERAKVLNVLLEIEAAQNIRHADDETFDNVADRVMTRHADLMRKLA